MGTLPHVLDLDAALLVHAFLEPRIPLDQQDERVLVETLGGRRRSNATTPAPGGSFIEATSRSLLVTKITPATASPSSGATAV